MAAARRHGERRSRRGIGIEALADDEDALTVRLPRGACESYAGRQGDIAAGLLPNELKLVGAGPHVRAAAHEGIGPAGGVVLRGAGMKDRADVVVTFEDPERLRKCREGAQRHRNCEAGEGGREVQGQDLQPASVARAASLA